MKKILRPASFLMAVVFMFCTIISNVSAETYLNTALIYNAVSIKIGSSNALVNGAFKNIDSANVKVTPYILNDRTMVPVRFIAEAFSATVNYDQKTRAVTVVSGNKTISLIIGKKVMKVNGSDVQMDAEATIANERTYIPLAFVAQALGMNKFYQNGLIIISPQGVTVNAATDVDTINFISSQLVTSSTQPQTPTVPTTPTTPTTPVTPTYPTTPTVPTVPVVGLIKIAATPDSKTISDTDETSSAVKVLAYYSDGSSKDVTSKSKYETSNKKVAYVTSDYKLHSGDDDGNATITISYQEGSIKFADSIKVTVEQDKTLERIVATPTYYFFDDTDDDNGEDVKVYAYYSDGSREDVTDDCDFDSKDDDIADVDDNQLVSGNDEGTTKIYVTYEEDDEEVEDVINVEVDDGGTVAKTLKSISVTPDDADFNKFNDEDDEIKVTATYSDNSTEDVTDECNFESDDENVAYINDDFEISSGDKNDEVDITITYSYNGDEEDCDIAVEVDADDDDDDDNDLVRIVASPAKYFFDDTNDEGDEVTVYAYYADGTRKDVTDDCDFDSDDDDVADVDDNVLISGDDEDTVDITVTYEGEEDTIEVTVDENGDPDKVLKSIEVTSDDDIDMETDDEYDEKVKVVAHYDDGSSSTITSQCNFKTDDEDVAYIDEDYVICSGDDEDEIEIEVTYEENGVEKSDTITVNVED